MGALFCGKDVELPSTPQDKRGGSDASETGLHEATAMDWTHVAIMGGIRRSPASETAHQQGFPSVFNLEAKLNSSWPTGASDCAKTAGKRLLATGGVGGYEGRSQLCSESSGPAGLLVDVAIEDVEKLRPEIDHRSLSDPGFLSYRDVLVSPTECARAR